MRPDKYLRTLLTAIMGVIVIPALAISCSYGKTSSPDYACDSTIISDEPDVAEEVLPSLEEGSKQMDMPDFSGEWKSTTEGFDLEMEIEQSSYTNEINVKTCDIYRADDWEPKGEIRNGKLILDDGNGSFYAEFELKGDRLYGKCKADSYIETLSFDGYLTMARVDTDNALYKLMNSGGGTYRHEETTVEEYDYGTVRVKQGIQIALKPGPQIAVVKQWGQDSWTENGEYRIDGYDVVITTDSGTPLSGKFSKNMSTLYLNDYEGQRISLKRIGDFDW